MVSKNSPLTLETLNEFFFTINIVCDLRSCTVFTKSSVSYVQTIKTRVCVFLYLKNHIDSNLNKEILKYRKNMEPRLFFYYFNVCRCQQVWFRAILTCLILNSMRIIGLWVLWESHILFRYTLNICKYSCSKISSLMETNHSDVSRHLFFLGVVFRKLAHFLKKVSENLLPLLGDNTEKIWAHQSKKTIFQRHVTLSMYFILDASSKPTYFSLYCNDLWPSVTPVKVGSHT